VAVADLLEPLAGKRRREGSRPSAGFGTFRPLPLYVAVIFAVFQFHCSGLSEMLQDNIAAAGKFLKRSGGDAA
jgi:hypothetical protein